MPKCQNCNHQWSWTDTVIIGFKNNKNCSNCGTRQYVAPNSQKGISLFIFIPLMLFVMLTSFYTLHRIVFVFLAAFYILGMVIYMPFTIKLSNEQKPLW